MASATADRIVLAAAEPFSLGLLWVEPARRLVSTGQHELVVEPRVMQMLVALAENPGRIVSRDELIERCWGGRIVGENAIHRAVSQARLIAASAGQGSFEIETIKSVGYRLVSGNAGLLAPAAAPPMSLLRTSWPARAT